MSKPTAQGTLAFEKKNPFANSIEAGRGGSACAAVALSVGILPAINSALYANDVPVLTELVLANEGDEPLGDVTVELTCDIPAMRAKTWRLSQVGAGQVRPIADLDIGLDGPTLSALTEGVRGVATVTARAGERLLAEVRRDIRFLAHNEWGGNSVIPDLLAAFVEPNDPAVPTIIRKASDLLRERGRPDSLEGYQATSKGRLWEQIAAIWSAVCSLDIRYVNPPPSFEQTGQRIRPPRQIVEERLATCLDLAVLFASSLEQVGFRPLIVLTNGHAFPGVWLSRHDFGTSVASDAASLRTRLALDDLLLFEGVLACHAPAPGFKRACAVGAQLVAAEHDADFDSVIDIRRARQRRIRPLSVPADTYARAPDSGGGSTATAGPPFIEEPPVLRDDGDMIDAEVSPTTPEGRLARWRKRLLDLSSRNRLLNLNVEGKQALPIDCVDPGRLEAVLAEMQGVQNARPLALRPWPDLMSGADPRSAQIHRNRLNEDASVAFAREAFDRRELMVARADEYLQASLTELYRTARAAQQEGGANTLFLTIGALLWKPEGKDKVYRAPLILVPVVLHRESVRSSFQLRAHDDETRLNTTLLEMLQQDYDVRIPELEQTAADEGHKLDVNVVLETFRLKARGISGWEVTDDVALTTLSFTKYLMWKDLADRADALGQSAVARRLMDGPEKDGTLDDRVAAAPSGKTSNYGGCLDDDPELTGLVCPMEADSSQLRAVAAAARGESFVLVGPPGTGKSQTIANIIANTLAQKRTVLFVAEKRAALEVVHRRLSRDEVRLGDFCLDLFSAKASKMAVLQQLDRAQQAREELDDEDWTTSSARVETLRAELNGYVRDLHRKGRNGWTAYRAIGTVLRGEPAGVPEIRLEWPDTDAHDAAGYQGLVEAVEEAAATLNRLGDVSARVALSGIDRTDWSPGFQVEIIEASRSAALALTALQEAAGPALNAMALPEATPATRHMLDALDDLSELLIDPAAREAAWALGDGAGEACEALYAAAAIALEHAALAAKLKGRWRPSISELPLDQLLAEWRTACGRWFVPRRSGMNAVRKRLAMATDQVPEDPVADLEALIAMRAVEAQFVPLANCLAPILGLRWQGLQTDFARVVKAVEATSSIRKATAACATDTTGLLAMREHVRHLLSDGADLLGETGRIGRPLRRFREAYAAAVAALVPLSKLCGRDAGSVIFEENPNWVKALAEHLMGWIASANHLRGWCAWRRTLQAGNELGLGPIFAALEAGTVGHSDAVTVFEVNYARWWVNLAVDDIPRLRDFVAAQHEQRIERFRALDVKLRDLSAKVVRARLAAQVPAASERQTSPEYGILTRELAKRQQHIPVRQLFAKMPNAIRKLGPCVMMSPLSVAQYLPADAKAFDLVIFDEASQIPTWDAIGAIGRASQVIVAGDPKQLPPTQFFQRQLPDGEAGTGGTFTDIVDLESVLDECLGAGIPRIELTWHYRSRHESLIAFSNQNYYGGSLVTFPSPAVRDRAVSFRHVPDAVYARGAARTNQAEARAVVVEVVRQLRAGPDADGREKSIGIVTFNAEQQALIENLLESERGNDPSLERFFSEDDNPEPVLVKNLEGVQGEERDVIIFSLTYGPDANGRLAMNFGPLNQAGGERRLNVAVTRAREALIVFGSLRPEQIDLGRTAAAGVSDLKLFLAFAEHGARAFATATTGSLGDFESYFEAVVADRLRAHGWVVHPQIGVSTFRIDLGVVDPGAPGSYLAGVECDGATYHRSASARDRDRLRQTVLEGLGWHILRVWSTDWWTNAVHEADRLHEALKIILEKTVRKRAERAAVDVVITTVDVPQQQRVVPVEKLMVVARPHGPERPQEGAKRPLPDVAPGPLLEVLDGLSAADFHEEHYRSRLGAIVNAIVLAEAPISDEQLSQRVARAHGFQRTGRLIKLAVMGVLPRECATTREGNTVFIWPSGVAPSSWSTFRKPQPGHQIDPSDVPIEELVILAQDALKTAGYDNECALLLMRDACGLGRLRETTRARCVEALDRVRAHPG